MGEKTHLDLSVYLPVLTIFHAFAEGAENKICLGACYTTIKQQRKTLFIGMEVHKCPNWNVIIIKFI